MGVKLITRTVWVLSMVSLFTDMASEMLYPVMPLFLRSIGFSVVLIGVLEGMAEATAGLSKGYFGQLSDMSGKRVPFVRIGYSLSAIAKPLLAVSILPLWIFLARCLDRLGKGIRTGARDAILSNEASPSTKGRVFGFHRSWDTVGAVVGPAIGLLLIFLFPGDYRFLFVLAIIPGLMAIMLTMMLSESAAVAPTSARRVSFFSYVGYWKSSSGEHRKVVAGLLCFSLINSSDVFLLLRARETGMSDEWVIGTYIFYNAVYAASSFPAGQIADRIGLRRALVIGIALFALVYGAMALGPNSAQIVIIFLVYGIYAAFNESIGKALITNICPKDEAATAVGTFTSFQSLCALFASSAAGWVWLVAGSGVLFGMTALLAAVVCIYFIALPGSR